MKTLFATITLAICANCAFAKDVPLTQYFSTPLTLNPAMTGLIAGDMRAAANYSQQYNSSVGQPWRAIRASFDMRVLKNLLLKGDALGVGILYQHNKPRDQYRKSENKHAGLSLAYHKSLGKAGRHLLSLGVQGAYIAGTVSERPSGPQFAAFSPYFDYNAGIMYVGALTARVSVYGGYSINHFTDPDVNYKQSPFFGMAQETHARHIVFIGGTLGLSKNIDLYANAAYQSHTGGRELQGTAYARIVLNSKRKKTNSGDVAMYAGGSYRYLDALCPYLGFELSNFRLGLSYNQNTYNFRPASGVVGIYELSLIYTGSLHKKSNATKGYGWRSPAIF